MNHKRSVQPTAEEINNTIQDTKKVIEILELEYNNYEIEQNSLKKTKKFYTLHCAIITALTALLYIAIGLPVFISVFVPIGICSAFGTLSYNHVTKDGRKLVKNFSVSDNKTKITGIKNAVSILEKKHEFLKLKELETFSEIQPNNSEIIITGINENLEEQIIERKDKQKILQKI